MIDLSTDSAAWRDEQASSSQYPVPPSREAQRRFDEMRRRNRTPSQNDAAGPGLELAAAATPLWRMLDAATSSRAEFGSAAGSAARDDGAAAASAPTATPAAACLSLASSQWQGRLTNGPWAGLELQVVMHARVARLTLRAASKQQYERLARMADTTSVFNELVRLPAGSSDSGTLSLQLELVDDARME